MKAAIQARDETKRLETLTELNGAMAELQAKHLAVIQNEQALLEQNEKLRSQLAAYDKWEYEKMRYALRQLPSGGFIYALSPGKAMCEPPHWLCTNCYEERHKSILQLGGKETGESAYVWVCPKCKNKIMSRGDWPTTLKALA